MRQNWIAIYYDLDGGIIDVEKFYDRTEDEACNESIGLMPEDCTDWSLSRLTKK